MDRRAFLGALAGGLLVAPLAARAQQAAGKVPLVGLLDFSTPDAARLNWWKTFRQALQELGYVNLKTAKALGLTIPQSFLQRANQVIE